MNLEERVAELEKGIAALERRFAPNWVGYNIDVAAIPREDGGAPFVVPLKHKQPQP